MVYRTMILPKAMLRTFSAEVCYSLTKKTKYMEFTVFITTIITNEVGKIAHGRVTGK